MAESLIKVQLQKQRPDQGFIGLFDDAVQGKKRVDPRQSRNPEAVRNTKGYEVDHVWFSALY